MKKICDYLKLSVFVVGVFVGVQIPGFVDQYGANLDSRVLESGKSVAEFQDDADVYFGGDLSRLIKHYNEKTDPVMIAGGESIGAIVSRYQFLTDALLDYRRTDYSAYTHVFFTPVQEINEDTWSRYSYRFILNCEAIFFSIASGVAVLASFEMLVLLFLVLFGRLKNRK